jgi:disulfide bond formation protein DsbB
MLMIMTTHSLRFGALAVAAGSAALLGGAYYFQYFEGLLPCILCLWQRPPHFIAAGFAAVAFVLAARQPGFAKAALGAAALALIVGAGIAFYHAGVEMKLWPGLAACGGETGPLASTPEDLLKGLQNARIVRCDEAAWSLAGVSMAGWNGILSLGLAALAFGALLGRPARRAVAA